LVVSESLRKKYHLDGSIEKYKARLLAKVLPKNITHNTWYFCPSY